MKTLLKTATPILFMLHSYYKNASITTFLKDATHCAAPLTISFCNCGVNLLHFEKLHLQLSPMTKMHRLYRQAFCFYPNLLFI